jgi:hypothetical protein
MGIFIAQRIEIVWRDLMTDLLYIVLTILFLVATWGFIELCKRLMENKQ